MMNIYHKHIQSTNNQSLLARIYGIFTFSTNQFKDLDVMIMQNTAQVYNKKNIRFSFDLKGSKIARKVKFNPKASY